MKKYLTYGISVFILAGLIFNAHQSLKKLSPDEAKIRNYGAEIDNLNYQLNQCKILVRGSKWFYGKIDIVMIAQITRFQKTLVAEETQVILDLAQNIFYWGYKCT